jgi:hypothetical protein
MSVPEMQSRLKGKVWQAIAQSGVNMTSIPQEELDRFVNAVAAGVLQEVDTLLTEASGVATSQPTPVAEIADTDDPNEETVLWEGRPFLSLSTHYTITTERVRIVEGILGKEREDIELVRIQDVDQKQGASERMLNLGDIHIRSHDPSNPEVILNNISNPQEVHEILRRAMLSARKRHNLTYREEM